MADLEKIFQEEKESNLVGRLIRKKSFKRDYDTQTIYGDLHDWFRDYHCELSLEEREHVIQRLIGQYVIKHIYQVKL